MLKLIEKSFLESERKIKLQLYILPIFLIYFYIYFTDNKTNIVSLGKNHNLTSLVSEKFDGSYLELVKELENFCLKNKIKISAINYNHNNLLIKGKTSLKKINRLIVKIENINKFSKINSLSIEKSTKKTQYAFEVNTEFKKYYIKTKNEKKIKEKKKSVINFNLKAIISNHVLLNNKWLTLNDMVGKHKIIRIEKNLVVLNYKDKKINLRLNKNE